MVKCSECGFDAKDPRGLASHMRLTHNIARGGVNRLAAEKFISELRRQGRIELVDAAKVQSVRSIADALDAEPQNAQMWRQYRDATDALLRQDDDANDGLEKALAELGRAPVGNTKET